MSATRDGDLGTMEQMILEDTHSLVSATKVRLKIIDSIRHHRVNRLWWSDRTFRFNLTANVREYGPGAAPGFPEDLVEIVGRKVWYLIGGSDSQRYPVWRVPPEEREAMLVYNTTGQPSRFDVWGGQFRLDCYPTSGNDVIEGRYVSDIGVPKGYYDTTTTAWVFKTPDGAADLTASFTNDWFSNDTAQAMIRHRTTYLLQAEVLKDPEAAETALQLWLEARSVVDEETEGKLGPQEITPWLLD